ncbi:MAG: ATP-binding protein [Chloroflexota bacterium]|nr:ATP-binding protein [Chloroflexota bacterium]
MPKRLTPDQHPKRTRYQTQRGRRGARIAALQARVAELEAQAGAHSTLQSATPTERINTLLAVSAALLVTHEIEAIMGLIVQRAVQLFPGASGALLFLIEDETGDLKLRAASSGLPYGLTAHPGQGPAGRAFLSPRAMLLVGPEFELALRELDPPQVAWIERMLQPWPPLSALLAPLRSETQRLGALVLYGGTHAHMFIPRDLLFVQALADLAAVAIAETTQRERAQLLQRNLTQTQSLHAETQARLDTAQAQLLQSAKLAAVGELAASVAHEINNPLYAARNSLYLVEQDLPPGAPQRQFLEIAQGELGRIARIITRMRDFYRPTRAELEPTTINDVLMATLDLVQTHLRHGQVGVTTDLAADLPQVTAHTDQIRQVFLNLMLNACDAMPNGGTLRITSHARSAGADQPAEIVVQIADTGVGIAPEHHAHLFEPFYTTKAQGTGLGLAISAHIITQHGGQIDVASQVGIGTTFTVRLPMTSDPATPLLP